MGTNSEFFGSYDLMGGDGGGDFMDNYDFGAGSDASFIDNYDFFDSSPGSWDRTYDDLFTDYEDSFDELYADRDESLSYTDSLLEELGPSSWASGLLEEDSGDRLGIKKWDEAATKVAGLTGIKPATDEDKPISAMSNRELAEKAARLKDMKTIEDLSDPKTIWDKLMKSEGLMTALGGMGIATLKWVFEPDPDEELDQAKELLKMKQDFEEKMLEKKAALEMQALGVSLGAEAAMNTASYGGSGGSRTGSWKKA